MLVKLLFLVPCLALASRERPASSAIHSEVTAAYYDKYVWRGQNLDDDPVLQPSLSASYQGLTAAIWGNLELTNINDKSGEFSEFDYTLDYTAAIPGVESLSFSAGVIHYRFPNTPFSPTTELYGGLSAAVPLSPAIKVYCDVDEVKGSYIQLAAGHIIEKIARWREDCYCGLQLGASTGWANSAYNKGYFGINESSFNDLTLSAGLPVCIELWTIRPSISYSTMLSGKIRSGTVSSDNLWGGISVSRSF